MTFQTSAAQTTATTCPYCGVGCGLIASKNANGEISVQADPAHPANLGRYCSKGAALGETLNPRFAPERLTTPTIAGEPTSWQTANYTIAERIRSVKEQYGANAIAFYLSGQLLTEDYYVANKLMKGFIGSANVDTNSRLCMSSAVAAYKRAFGSDTVPCDYRDLEVADLIVLVGSNAAWTHPVLYQRMLAAKEARPELKIVLIDPRETPTAQLADLHLKIKPSSDGFVFQGLMQHLISTGTINQDYIDSYTENFPQIIAACGQLSQAEILDATDVSAEELDRFYRWFAQTDKVVSFYSQGINQSATGTDKATAIINCHLATGRLGYAGAGPFSITGQPNAMGGREVGGLANMLAAHMDFNDQDRDTVQRFWQAPGIATQPGLKAVDLFKAIHQGEIKFIWIMATNPVVSMPDSNFVRAALEKCETVVISDVTHTDTTAYADIVLPALAWGEKDGTVTNSERCISRQRAFLPPPADAKADWQALSGVASELGYQEQFDYQSSYEVFLEHARLSDFENNGQRDFDIGALIKLDYNDYQNLQPSQWPLRKADGLNEPNSARLFSDGRFYTNSGKAQFIATSPTLAKAVNQIRQDNEFVLNSGRSRDQWHTMTRTGYAPSLTQHGLMPELSIHPGDAKRLDLSERSVVRLESQFGQLLVQLKISQQTREGDLFAPMHWSQQFAKHGLVNALAESIVDPVSGQPELKAVKVRLSKVEGLVWQRIISKQGLRCHPEFEFWSTQFASNAWVTTLATEPANEKQNLLCLLNKLACSTTLSVRQSFYNPLKALSTQIIDDDAGIFAIASQTNTAENLPSSRWLSQSFLADDAAKIIRGEQGEFADLVCACFSTTNKEVKGLIKAGANDLATLAAKAGCGSKCGSCRPELNDLICKSL